MTVPLVNKKSNTTGTHFELKFACVFNKPSPYFIGIKIQTAAAPLGSEISTSY